MENGNSLFGLGNEVWKIRISGENWKQWFAYDLWYCLSFASMSINEVLFAGDNNFKELNMLELLKQYLSCLWSLLSLSSLYVN